MMTNGQYIVSLVNFSLTTQKKFQYKTVDIWWEDLRTGFRLNIGWQMAKIWPVWLIFHWLVVFHQLLRKNFRQNSWHFVRGSQNWFWIKYMMTNGQLIRLIDFSVWLIFHWLLRKISGKKLTFCERISELVSD